MRHAILILALLAGSGAPARSAPPAAERADAIFVTFRPAAEVRDRVIRLRDVAAVESPDAELVARLEAVEVGAAPLSGHSRTVSAAYARVRIRQLGIEPERLRIQGAELITITRPEQVLPGAEVERAVREAVEAAHPDAGVDVTAPAAEQRLPLGKVEVKTAAPRLAGSSGTVLVTLLVDGQPEASLTVAFRLMRKAAVVVAAHDLQPGTVLAETDLRIEERPVTPGPLLLGDAGLAVGQQVARPIRAGTALTAAMLKPPVLIRRGERVKLICRGPGFTVTATGEALHDGIAGQPLRVRNVSSLLELTGRVVAAQLVEVPF